MGFLGAKAGSGTYQAIINLMPPHIVYIEPFFGTGAIMLRKVPVLSNIGIDLDTEPGQQTIVELKAEWPHGNFHLLKRDAIQFLTDGLFDRKTLIYCDCPYMHSTRTSKARYKHELTDDDHAKLLKILRSLKCFVMVSGYRNPLYEQKLANWFSIDYQAMTRGGVRTETVWCNFEPSAIHYHTYAGKDFTDRQRIKRKAERWAARYVKLPPGERQAILAALLGSGTR